MRPAQREYDDSGDWYESRRKGLGRSFSDAVELVFGRIVAHPETYAEIVEGVREAPVSVFLFVSIFGLNLNLTGS